MTWFFSDEDRQALLNIQANVRLIMADVKGVKKAFEDYRDNVQAKLTAANEALEAFKSTVQQKIDEAIAADDAEDAVEIQDVLTEIQAAADALKPVEVPPVPVITDAGEVTPSAEPTV